MIDEKEQLKMGERFVKFIEKNYEDKDRVTILMRSIMLDEVHGTLFSMLIMAERYDDLKELCDGWVEQGLDGIMGETKAGMM